MQSIIKYIDITKKPPEILEVKSTVTEIKSSLKCHNSRFKKVEFKKKTVNMIIGPFRLSVLKRKKKKE